MLRTRRTLNDVLLSLVGLCLLLGTLAALDKDVRQQISLRLAASSSPSQVFQPAREVAVVVFSAIRDQSINHAPMTIFVVVGTVLLVFMLRT